MEMFKLLLLSRGLFFVCLMGYHGVLLSADYYVDSLTGYDANSGQTQDKPWKTLDKLNKYTFFPGDNIYLRRVRVWRETLVVSSSGREGLPITFSTYGEGDNPLIMTTEPFDNWQLVFDDMGAKVWHGKIKGIKNHWGATKNAKRTKKYFGYKAKKKHEWLSAPKSLSAMKDGFFFSPLNKEGFFYRNDQGHPGLLEVGARRYGIQIKNKNNIVIDSIDAFGPGGDSRKGSAKGVALISVDASDNVVIKNNHLSSSYGNGISIEYDSTHCTIDNVKSYGHRATGIYLWEAGVGNRILNSEVFDCGTVSTDTGDMGLIGVWQTPSSTIESCYVHNNGHPNVHSIDAAISIVQSPLARVTRNHVNYSGGGGIQVAESSDDSKIFENVVANWCVFGDTFLRENTHCEGIRIGGGKPKSTSTKTSVSNNMIVNGRAILGERAALRITKHNSDGLQVSNNIFYKNKTNYSLIADSKNKRPVWFFSNNVFDGKSIGIKVMGKSFNSSHYDKQVPLYFSKFGARWDSIVGVPKKGILENK